MCQCQGTHQHIFRHLCLPGVSGHVRVSAFLLPKEMETIPGPPEFDLVCPLIAGLRGKREGGREGGEKSGWGRDSWGRDSYVSLTCIHPSLCTSFPRARQRVCVCVCERERECVCVCLCVLSPSRRRCARTRSLAQVDYLAYKCMHTYTHIDTYGHIRTHSP